ncbi:MAG: DUF4476 domain-containing protein [Bacteroidota bacterium]|nr:DUF4476 domain-containing protein [Bacteroidota bacterium]
MKKLRPLVLLTMLLILGNTMFAQNSNAIIFSENGEKFTAILNGLRQNENPETNVKIEGLNANFYKLKIIFDDTALGQKNFNLNMEPGTETTFIIKKNNKNEYVLRPMSMVPVAEAPPTTTGTTVITYNPNAAPYTGETTITEQTNTTTTTAAPAGTGVSMGINVDDGGGNFSMNVSGFEGTSTTNSQHTTTVTTTTTTSSSSAPPSPAPAPVVYLPGYGGPVGCPVPMERGDFQSMKGSISSKSFEDSKLTMAKQVINSNCLLSAQVREIMQLFTYEESKLDFAKYAYGRTYDIGNYYKVNDAFTFESSIEELNAYINAFAR